MRIGVRGIPTAKAALGPLEQQLAGRITEIEALKIELRFAQPVRGLIAMGFACHFGFGLFARAPDA